MVAAPVLENCTKTTAPAGTWISEADRSPPPSPGPPTTVTSRLLSALKRPRELLVTIILRAMCVKPQHCVSVVDSVNPSVHLTRKLKEDGGLAALSGGVAG
jgi:hypothetical protein